jgi:hypothetical protein
MSFPNKAGDHADTDNILRAELAADMPRDEMLQYYSDYANLCATEALRYQKRIFDLESKLTQPALSESDIKQVITKAVQDGCLPWCGFEKDGAGMYTVPVLSKQHYGIARAIEAHYRGGANHG